MERIIAPYGSPHPPMGAGPQSGAPVLVIPPKTGRDYIRALRRRWWLALLLALVVIVPGTMLVLRMPAIYQAQAEIEIVPPQFDAALAVIVEHVDNLNRENAQLFVLNKIAQLKAKGLLDRVVHEFEPADPAAAAALAAEMYAGLVSKQVPGTNLFQITLDSRDQNRVAKQLNSLLKLFSDDAYDRGHATINLSKRKANETLIALRKQLTDVETEIGFALKEAPFFAADGRNLLEEDYLFLKSMVAQKQVRHDDLLHEQRIAELWPHLKEQAAVMHPTIGGQLTQLYTAKKQYEQQLTYMKRTLRTYKTDPYVRAVARELDEVNDDIEELQQAALPSAQPNLSAMSVSRASQEIGNLKQELLDIQTRMQRSAPLFQKYLSLLENAESIKLLIQETANNLIKFEQVSGTLKLPVEIVQRASAPLAPVRPNRLLSIVLVTVLGMAVSCGFICFAEAIDRVVKAPEHVTGALALPLLGVVPRMRRLAQMSRGGHLWASGSPESVEADAFRNLRASLIGIEHPDRAIVSVLITSAKAEDGKSTTALNLAAACARAGERVILVDCDLRRPSLASVFDADPSIGLVDVLTGEIPWQQATAVCPDLRNLNFLPAGHLGGAPIEILCSSDLKQLIAELSRHYHRVVLDAPAVLGLADGRILGSLADSTLLVVRSGAHELGPLVRAKQMLEQTRARLAGVVFNDLNDDMHNWSSYGPGDLPRQGGNSPAPARLELESAMARQTVSAT